MWPPLCKLPLTTVCSFQTVSKAQMIVCVKKKSLAWKPLLYSRGLVTLKHMFPSLPTTSGVYEFNKVHANKRLRIK